MEHYIPSRARTASSASLLCFENIFHARTHTHDPYAFRVSPRKRDIRPRLRMPKRRRANSLASCTRNIVRERATSRPGTVEEKGWNFKRRQIPGTPWYRVARTITNDETSILWLLNNVHIIEFSPLIIPIRRSSTISEKIILVLGGTIPHPFPSQTRQWLS